MSEFIQWCSFCNEAPADGIVTLEDQETGHIIRLPACEPCAKEMNWS